MLARLPLALFLALPLLASRAAAEPRLVVAFDDPAGDADGPGSYRPPTAPGVTADEFDLRRFAVWQDGDDVVLEVTFAAPVRRPGPDAGPEAAELDNGLWLQNVDVYVDTDPTPGAGSAACIPGRRVAFADGRTWERAVVLTPRPAPARAAVTAALGAATAARVLFPGPLQIRDRSVFARVPASALGGPPRREWGWSVQVSGARWERSALEGEPSPAKRAADAFTLPVLPEAGPRAFGGAPAGEAHPRVVDVLLPPGADQKAVLGSFDARTGAFARVPFVYAPAPPVAPPIPSALAPRLGAPPSLSPRAPAPPASPAGSLAPAAPAAGGGAGPILTVAELSDDVATLAGPNIGLAPQQVGRVLGRDGATVGHVVVDRVLENGVVARIVSGRENVRWGARVRFDVRPPQR
jgi:hypothetical protein